jgi:hypothetical protein
MPEAIGPYVPYLIAAVAAVVLLAIAFVWLRRKKPHAAAVPPPAIELSRLGERGPPAAACRLECYEIPVRLAALVLAPAGASRALPPRDFWSALIDQIVPGLAEVVRQHGTELMAWPPQLSPRGFSQQFFSSLALPGDHGKGSRWCAVAGRFEASGQPWMVGMALCADKPNSLSEYLVESTGWLGVLRVRQQPGA